MLRTLRRIIGFFGHPRKTLAYRTKPVAAPLLQRFHRWRLSQRVDLDFLSQRPPTGFPPDFSDLWFLYQTVRKRKPRVVLEFGSGSSTVAIAQAIADNKARDPGLESHLYSIDDQRYWADVTRQMLPRPLHGVCDVLHVPALEVEEHGEPCWRHAGLPGIIPDFVHLDGPTFTENRKIAVDILDMEDLLPPDFFMVIDGREKNTAFLQRHLKRPFRFRHRIWYYNTVVTLASNAR